MASRNLTKRFIAERDRSRALQGDIRDHSDKDADGTQSLLQRDASSAIVSVAALPPVWVDLVDAIEADAADIQRNLTKLSRLHQQRLKVSFDDDDEAQDRKIDALADQITALFRKSESRLKRIATIGNVSGNELPYQERVVRLNVMRSLGARIQTLSKKFRHMQKDFLINLKGRDKKTNEFFDDSKDSFEDGLDHGFTEAQLVQLEEAKNSTDEREREIAQIAESINDLATIFRELSVLVVEQGSILDRIDYNVEQTLSQVKAGTQEMRKAEEYQKRGKSTCCIVLLLFAIAGCILLLVYRHQ